MKYQASISPEVASQILAASSYLDGIQDGMGVEFEREIETTLESISTHPNLYPKEFGPLRRALVRRFKQNIYYYIRGDVFVVVEVRDARRESPDWKSRGFRQ